MKKEVMDRITSVLNTLDGGIEIRGAQNARNLAGAFMILREVFSILDGCEIVPPKKEPEHTPQPVND